MQLVDAMKRTNTTVRFERSTEDSNLIEILFDANHEKFEQIKEKVLDKHPEANLEKIDVLPQWAKRFLLRVLPSN